MIESRDELQELIHESRKREYCSQYNFIKAHNGYRKGKMHLAIGPSSGGKSTLTRSLLLDFLLNLEPHEKVHLHLSEETHEEFLIEIGSTGISFDKIKQIKVTSEQDHNFKSVQDLFVALDDSLRDVSVAGLFFDNITTSFAYMDRKADAQALVSKKLKELSKKNNIPLILIAHTSGDSTMANSRLIEMNDIRGGKSIVNLAEFMYILQPFFVEDERFNIVRIVKHRGVSLKDPYYKLIYAEKPRMFVCDQAIKFSELKELFKKRNIL